jgi:hypothetical protein
MSFRLLQLPSTVFRQGGTPRDSRYYIQGTSRDFPGEDQQGDSYGNQENHYLPGKLANAIRPD